MTRSNWEGTYGKRIILTANEALKKAQETPSVEPDNIEYPKYDQIGFYEGSAEFDEIKLIYLRGKDYNDPLWDILLDRMSWKKHVICFMKLCVILAALVQSAPSHRNKWSPKPTHPRTSSGASQSFRICRLLIPDNVNQLPPHLFVTHCCSHL